MYRALGIALIIFGLGLAIIPQFTDCLSQGNVLTLASGSTQPMKCHWTAQAEIAVGIPLIGVGIMSVVNRRGGKTASLAITGLILGAMAIILPYNLIGTCMLPTHICNTAMKPALTALGSLTVASSLGMLVLSRRAATSGREEPA